MLNTLRDEELEVTSVSGETCNTRVVAGKIHAVGDRQGIPLAHITEEFFSLAPG
jgi:hypothetical protein